MNAIKLTDYLAAGRTDDIHQRILDMKEKRQNLGLRLRALVLEKFSGDRYLREHEQMLWIGKFQSFQNCDNGVELDHTFVNFNE